MSIVLEFVNGWFAIRAAGHRIAAPMVAIASFVLIAAWSTPSAAAINLSVTAHRCGTTAEQCPSPAYVYFDASTSTCTAGECGNGWDQLDYEWNFGDSASGTWVNTGEPMNRAYGPIAFHVFEPAGANDFTVTVSARARNGATASRSLTIYVDSPAALQTRCIAKDD